MKTISDLQAGPKLKQLIKEATDNHEPIQITGKQGSAVLLSEQDWRSIEETLYLLSIPGMRESIRDGMNTPIAECSSDLTW
jgi:antitoxin YefM